MTSTKLKRSREKFDDSLRKLKETLPKTIDENFKGIPWPEPLISNDQAIESLASNIETAIENFIQHMQTTRDREKDSRVKRIKCAAQQLIRASAPYVDLVLTIAKESSSVHPSLLRPNSADDSYESIRTPFCCAYGAESGNTI